MCMTDEQGKGTALFTRQWLTKQIWETIHMYTTWKSMLFERFEGKVNERKSYAWLKRYFRTSFSLHSKIKRYLQSQNTNCSTQREYENNMVVSDILEVTVINKVRLVKCKVSPVSHTDLPLYQRLFLAKAAKLRDVKNLVNYLSIGSIY